MRSTSFVYSAAGTLPSSRKRSPRPYPGRPCGRGGVFVVYDRLSRRYWLEKLSSIDQESVIRAIRRMRASKRIGQIRSVVTDNGCEFLDQTALDKAFGAKVFYTRAYASYEKGGVENCNRILRRWFPKGTDFSQVSTGPAARPVSLDLR